MKRSLLTAAASVFLFCATSLAQTENPRYEIGFKAGAGGYTYLDDRAGGRAVFGVEGCAFCGGRYALFGAYDRFLAPANPSAYGSAGLLTAGLRIQGRRKISPFFDVGFAAGHSRYQSESTTTAGGGIGAGVTFRTEKGLYARPQFRLYVDADGRVSPAAQMAIGWRF